MRPGSVVQGHKTPVTDLSDILDESIVEANKNRDLNALLEALSKDHADMISPSFQKKSQKNPHLSSQAESIVAEHDEPFPFEAHQPRYLRKPKGRKWWLPSSELYLYSGRSVASRRRPGFLHGIQ